MPDLCRGSGGAPKPLTAGVIQGGTAAISEFIAKRADKEAAALIGAIVGGTTILTSQLCSSPAPDIPTLTALDYLHATVPSSQAEFVAAVAKFTDWFLGNYWAEICQCNDGQPPAQPTNTVPPPVDQNRGLPTGSGSGKCWDLTYAGTIGHQAVPLDVTLQVVPATVAVNVTPQNSAAPHVAQKIPDGLANVVETITTGPPPADNIAPNLSIECFDASGSSLGTRGGFGGFNLNLSQPVTIPPGTASWSAWQTNQNNQPYSWSFEWAFDCNGSSPTVLEQPCCPPDPQLDIKLTQILNLLLALPSAGSGGYTRGTVHPAASGSGSLNVSGLAGLEVVVTTGTPTNPLLEGNPPYQWNLGWLSASDGGGMLQEQRLTRAHQIWVPREATTASVWGYFLFPGIVATITELRAV